MGKISRQQREAQILLNTLESRLHFAVQGVTALAQMRDAILGLTQDLGIRVVIDRTTPAQLQDYLLGVGMEATKSAFTGAILGLLFGTLTGKPKEGLLLGTGLGAMIGGLSGVSAVQRGVRIRAGYVGSTPWIEAYLEE